VSILAIDSRTGETIRTLADGALSSDRATLYAPEQVSGATQTVIHVIDVATGGERRSFVLDGAYRATWTNGGQNGLSSDDRHLAIASSPYKLDDQWVTRFAVVETASGAAEARFEVKESSTYGFAAMSPDGRSLYLNQFGEGETKIRVFDVASRSLLPTTAIKGASGLTQRGYRTPGVVSPDGRWMWTLDAGNPSGSCNSSDGPRCTPNPTELPYVLALDLVSRRAVTIPLPPEQRSSDFEKYLLWSIGFAPDGATAYAINPALGLIDEFDAKDLKVRRVAPITVSRAAEGTLGALGRVFFPVAEAKRYITGGALVSPDGRIYAAAYKGISVLGAADLSSRAVWETASEFDSLALTPDGERLYAVSNGRGRIVIIGTRDGARLGELKIPAYGQMIVRIDSAR
jgi:DNA-binding beta-propeller fold protein YncE